jgi:peptide-methionine (S)-S-oxide reductase
MFWFVHYSTQLNCQGNDTGTQHRSAIFYHSEDQKETAEKYKHHLSEEKVCDSPIFIEITLIHNHSEAEAYHHDYLKNNPQNPYCQSLVRPKVDKFRKVFQEKLK